MTAEPLAARIAALTGTSAVALRQLASVSICPAWRVELSDGRVLFAKTHDDTELLATEAASLRWLSEAAAVPLPAVVAVADGLLLLDWVETGTSGPAAAERFGRELAALHRAGSEGFGAPWTGYAGPLPHGNESRPTWPEFFAVHRLLPYVQRARDAGSLEPSEVATLEAVIARLPELAGPAEPPARLHGDLWHGNLLWSRDGRVWLVDAAAYGGHRETDLGTFTLFGAPELGRILAAYQEVWPLAEGWRERQRLNQLHPLLVHATLFGRQYGVQAVQAADAYR